MEQEMLRDSVELKPRVVPKASKSDRTEPSVPELSRKAITVSWNNLSCKVLVKKVPKYILRDLSGLLRPGELTAILGPSGSGKTTLLNILSGFQPTGYEGELSINGRVRKSRHLRKLASYVMNGDFLLPQMTVRESLEAAALLKLTTKVTAEERATLIDKILSVWSLEDCANTTNRNLSTGQRKRLSVAQELVSNPPVVFLDEPTSGLDSSNSLQCILTLKAFAARGHTVACSIHQQSSKIFQLFDKLYVLADGHCIYNNTVHACVSYLSSQGLHCPAFYNPADFLIEVASGDYGDVTAELARKAKEVTQVVAPGMEDESRDAQDEDLSAAPLLSKETEDLQRTGGASLCLQIRVLLKRCCVSMLREPLVFHLRLGTNVLVGVLMGLLYYGIGDRGDAVFNNATFVFFSLLFLLFAGMMPVVLIFPLEASVFVREHANSWYSLKAYFLAKTIADVPFQIVFPTLFVSIVYWMTWQPPELNRFLIFTLMAVLLSLAAQSLGMLIGAIASAQSAVFLAPAVTIPLLLFSGFVISLRDIPGYLLWISNVSYVRYAYEGSMLAIYGFQRAELHCDTEAIACLFTEPHDFLHFLGFDAEDVYIAVTALLVVTLLFKVATYVALRFRVRRAART